MVQVTVLFSNDLVENRENKSFDSRQFGSYSGSNIVFEPNDPESNDSELKRYHSAEVENEGLAQELVNMLLKSPYVEAAWVWPQDSPPN